MGGTKNPSSAAPAGPAGTSWGNTQSSEYHGSLQHPDEIRAGHSYGDQVSEEAKNTFLPPLQVVIATTRLLQKPPTSSGGRSKSSSTSHPPPSSCPLPRPSSPKPSPASTKPSAWSGQREIVRALTQMHPYTSARKTLKFPHLHPAATLHLLPSPQCQQRQYQYRQPRLLLCLQKGQDPPFTHF